MKIGLNATCINDRPSGAKHRFIGIYRELVKFLPKVEFLIYEPSDSRVGSWFDGSANIRSIPTPMPSEGRSRRFFAGLTYWRKHLAKENFDFFECFNQPLVKAPSGQTILTIHDIRRVQADWEIWERVAYKSALKRDLRSADHVITVSYSMKAEILRVFPDALVSVIHNGIDALHFSFVTEIDIFNFRNHHQLPQNFLLAVGHLEKRKNYLRLIEAVGLLRKRGNECSLVVIGNDSGEEKVIMDRVRMEGLSDQVILLRGLSDMEVRCAYKACSLFVFPSSYEGFGIPILEAMAADCPMVLSDIPVFRELTENEGVYFQHDDARALANSIEYVLASISERERQIRYGRMRILDFQYVNIACQLAELYNTISEQ